MDVMATEKDRLTITHDQELREKLDRVKEAEGVDADADVGRQLLRRGLDDWQRERATYPGSDLVARDAAAGQHRDHQRNDEPARGDLDAALDQAASEIREAL